jgi:hypothetical protein
MKLLAWNCIGLSRASATRSLRVKIRKHSPDVIFLYETKIDPSVACIIMNRLSFFFMTHVPPIGTKGGLLLTWRHGVELECFATNMYNISAWCYSDPSYYPWLLACIYGSPYYSSRAQFWDDIMSIEDKYSRPWLCLGDFNMILDQSEKKKN